MTKRKESETAGWLRVIRGAGRKSREQLRSKRKIPISRPLNPEHLKLTIGLAEQVEDLQKEVRDLHTLVLRLLDTYNRHEHLKTGGGFTDCPNESCEESA